MIIQLLEEPTYLYFDQLVMKVYKLPIMYTTQLPAVEVYNVRHPQGTMSMREREIDLWFQDAQLLGAAIRKARPREPHTIRFTKYPLTSETG